MKPARIELHIEELVLHGFAPGGRYAIGDAVEHALTRLFGERGLGSSSIEGRECAHLNAGDVHVAPASPPEAVGTQVAQAVYGGLTR